MLYPQNNESRCVLSLDGLWEFRRQSTGENPQGWESGFDAEHRVPVPGSFNDLFTDYDTHMGVAWYKTDFTVPRMLEGKRLILRFGSANYYAEVYLNGQRLGSHETGYTPFEFDVSSMVTAGSNTLVVKLATALSPDTCPQGNLHTVATEAGQFTGNTPKANFDFFPYGGIHRPVVLYATEQTWLDELYVDTSLQGSGARIDIRAAVKGDNPDQVSFEIEGTDCRGMVEPSTGAVETSLTLRSPRLWSPDSPHLYQLVVTVRNNGEIVDTYRQSFGVREVRLEGNQLLLNGKPIYLRGFGKHEDFFLSGKALNHAVNVRDIKLLKWINANSFRTSHYPYAEEMLNLCDQEGILVVGETPAVSIATDYASDKTLNAHLLSMTEMIRRDYNHPSVIMWSLANECTTHRDSARPYFEKVAKTAREQDSSRPLLLVMCHWPNEKCWDLADVVGINSYPGWYGGGAPLKETVEWWNGFLDKTYNSVHKPIMLTEFGGDALAGCHNLPSELWTEDYQRDLLDALLAVTREKDYLIGEHIWAFADFRTGQNDRRAYGNRKGVFTRDRQPKMAAYALRKIWREMR